MSEANKEKTGNKNSFHHKTYNLVGDFSGIKMNKLHVCCKVINVIQKVNNDKGLKLVW